MFTKSAKKYSVRTPKLGDSIISFFSFPRVPFIITRRTGVIKLNTTFVEERLGLMHKRPSYRPTGTHPSPRSVLEWRSANRSTSLSSTSRPTLCTHWSLTGNTATSHWVVTRGRIWLVYRLPCRITVTRKASMLCVLLISIQKYESGSLEIMKTTAIAVIPESGLEREENMMTTTRVETRQSSAQIMKTSTSKPWVTSWCNDVEWNKFSRERIGVWAFSDLGGRGRGPVTLLLEKNDNARERECFSNEFK